MTLDKLRASLQEVIHYNWDDERHDYCARTEGRELHIFNHLVALNNFLNGSTFTPASYAPSTKIGGIYDNAGTLTAEVFELLDGTVLVEGDAANGTEDDVYATQQDMEECLDRGFHFILTEA